MLGQILPYKVLYIGIALVYLRVAVVAETDKVLFDTKPAPAPFDEMVYLDATGLPAIDTTSPPVKLVSLVDRISNFFWYVC